MRVHVHQHALSNIDDDSDTGSKSGNLFAWEQRPNVCLYLHVPVHMDELLRK